jgi:hydroxymethylbilane synthase
MAESNPFVLRLGTRGSLLARAQSGLVARLLEQHHPGLRVEIIVLRTTGDQITDKPLYEFGGKGLFTKELEQALLATSIDFAVHSFKDVPVTMPLVDQTDLVVAAVPKREDPRDVLVSKSARSLKGLGERAHVGTGSLRRRAQLLHLRPDLIVEPIRGNIDTRLRKCLSGEYDGVILAMAGLKRAGLFDESTMFALEPAEMLPSPAQGALALQCRREDPRTRELLSVLNDPVTAACVSAEREVVQLLKGDCHSPIGALAESCDAGFKLTALIGAREGKPPVIIASHSARYPLLLARKVVEILAEQGAMAILHGDNAKTP